MTLTGFNKPIKEKINEIADKYGIDAIRTLDYLERESNSQKRFLIPTGITNEEGELVFSGSLAPNGYETLRHVFDGVKHIGSTSIVSITMPLDNLPDDVVKLAQDIVLEELDRVDKALEERFG